MRYRLRAPAILALDFDGVLCEGSREYFETSRRTYLRTWPRHPVPGDELFALFRDLRPVIETGWEMPVLLKAIVRGEPPAAIRRGWTAVRDQVMSEGSLTHEELMKALRTTLDDVRREWIGGDAQDWLDRHALYCEASEVRHVTAQPEQAVIVTTKEGEFARRLLDHWGIPVAEIHGKESGSHKCDNLRQLIAEYQAARGLPPGVWFVEDRLETLRCVTTHRDLDGVGLFLAAWGYNTPEIRESVRRDPRIQLLTLERFRRGLGAWA